MAMVRPLYARRARFLILNLMPASAGAVSMIVAARLQEAQSKFLQFSCHRVSRQLPEGMVDDVVLCAVGTSHSLGEAQQSGGSH
jgi:hypothetical protein